MSKRSLILNEGDEAHLCPLKRRRVEKLLVKELVYTSRVYIFILKMFEFQYVFMHVCQ